MNGLRARGAHRLAGLHLADRAGDRTDDPRLAATLDFGFVGRRLEHASDARGRAGNHRHRLPGHPDYAAIDERRSRRDTGVVDQKLRGRTVSRIDYKIMRTDETRRVGRVERKRMPLDLDAGESLAEPSRRRHHFRRADIRSAKDHLAREIRQLDRVGIDERQPMRARPRERPQGGDAKSSDADDQYSISCHFLAHLPFVESATRSVLTGCR